MNDKQVEEITTKGHTSIDMVEFLADSKNMVGTMPKLYTQGCAEEDCDGKITGRSYFNGELTIYCLQCGNTDTYTDEMLKEAWIEDKIKEVEDVVNDSVQDE